MSEEVRRHTVPDEPAGIKHIGHECSGRCRPGSIDDVCHNRWQGRGNSICDNRSGCRPGKNLNLTWRVQDDVAVIRSVRYKLLGARHGTHSTVSALCSTIFKTWSNLVVNRLRAVKIPPFGPRLYLDCELPQKTEVTHPQTRGRNKATDCFMTSE